jgi:RimJ/RimL family protein N-acetyltransferase
VSASHFSHLERTLVGNQVVLRPLALADAEALFEAVGEDRSTYGFTPVPRSLDDAHEYIDAALRDAAAGHVVAFSVRRRVDETVVGTTRFLNLRWYFGRQFPDIVEIGGTWYSPQVQRTAVNTETKRLLLRLAFEDFGVGKVDLKTDARNTRSRNAIARLGATFEGVSHQAHPSYVDGEEGLLRDSAMFGIVREQWPDIDRHLERLLAR